MPMSITLFDIAKHTGYSISTVSRVLHTTTSKYKISSAASERIRKTAAELGYQPNPLAQGLRLKRSLDIGVIVTDLADPFFASIIKSIAREVRRSGYGLIVSDSDDDTNIEKEAITTLLRKKVAGLIIAPVGLEGDHLLQVKASGTPIVMVDRCLDHLELDSVTVDNCHGGWLATRHLIDKGHRRIAFLQGLEGTQVNSGRLAGFRKALAEADIPFEARQVVGNDFSIRNGYSETRLLLKRKDRPSAIFASSDLIALGALEAVKEEKFSVPYDISIIAFDDPIYAASLSPPLTTIEQPVEKMGEIAAKMLLRHLTSTDHVQKKILLEPQLQIRESVAALNASDRTTAQGSPVSLRIY
jgi:LacI family transcriptional regulator